MAVAGVPTPLLAVHWYWIMLSGVPGLLTFSMVSDAVLGNTSKLPSLVHDTLGWGLPDALQVNVMLSPSSTVSLILSNVIEGGSTMNSVIFYISIIKLESFAAGLHKCNLAY